MAETKLLEVQVERGDVLVAHQLWNGSIFVYRSHPDIVFFKLNDSKAIPLVQNAGGHVETCDIRHRDEVYKVAKIVATLGAK